MPNTIESEERYRKIVEDFTGFIVRWLPGGKRTFISQSYCRYFGVTREQAESTDFLDLVYPPDREMVAARVRSLTLKNPVIVGEHRVIHSDKSIRWMEWTDRALFDADGVLLEYQSIGYDIDERKQSAEILSKAKAAAEAASLAKSQFLGMMSHEMRTPLNCIVGSAGLLQTTDLSETQSHFVDRILSSSHLLVSLIDDILDIARIESQGVSIEPRRVDVSETIATVVGICRLEAEKKQILLVFERGVPCYITTDPRRLQQVALNLISNAIKFTPKGSVTVSLRQSADHKSVAMEVKDTGIGIQESHHTKIFDSFYQVDMSSTRRYEGTGLGLFLVRRILDAMGGSVGVDSELGQGSKFVVTIPTSEAPPDRQSPVFLTS